MNREIEINNMLNEFDRRIIESLLKSTHYYDELEITDVEFERFVQSIKNVYNDDEYRVEIKHITNNYESMRCTQINVIKIEYDIKTNLLVAF